MRMVSRLLAVALSLALLAGGILVAVEVVVAEFGRDPWVLPHDQWYRSASETSWSASSSRWLFSGLIAAGVILLLLQLARRRPAALPLEAQNPQHPAEVRRRSVERSLARVVGRVDGVAMAKARVSPGRARVRAMTNRRLIGDLEARVSRAAEQRLASLHLAAPPPVKVRIHQRAQR